MIGTRRGQAIPAIPITTDRQRGIASDAVSALWVLGFLTDPERQFLAETIDASRRFSEEASE